MECSKVNDNLVDYIENNLSEKVTNEYKAHINSCKKCEAELNEMQQLLKDLSNDNIEYPSENLRRNFEDTLSEEKKNQKAKVVKLKAKINWKLYLQIAASILLIFSAFLFGRYQQKAQFDQQVAELKTEGLEMKQTVILALVDNKSASRRIEGVQYVEEFSDPDPEIVNALIKRMLNDENVNVRLTAANALQRFMASEAVKDGFIKALETEKDPGIQITIIHSLVKIQEKKALRPMQQLLEQEETQPFVKEEIKTVLSNII